jgi:rubrerythrin
VNIFEYAKKLEKDSELFYRDLAERSFEIGVAVILARLADEEVRHFIAVEALERGETPSLGESDVLADARNVIDLVREKDGLLREDLPEAEVFTLALDIEQKSSDFYEDCIKKTQNDAHREIFSRLARQEHEHYMTIELMSDLMRGS